MAWVVFFLLIHLSSAFIQTMFNLIENYTPEMYKMSCDVTPSTETLQVQRPAAHLPMPITTATTTTITTTTKYAENSFPNSEKCYAQTINSFVIDQFQYRYERSEEKKKHTKWMHFCASLHMFNVEASARSFLYRANKYFCGCLAENGFCHIFFCIRCFLNGIENDVQPFYSNHKNYLPCYFVENPSSKNILQLPKHWFIFKTYCAVEKNV